MADERATASNIDSPPARREYGRAESIRNGSGAGLIVRLADTLCLWHRRVLHSRRRYWSASHAPRFRLCQYARRFAAEAASGWLAR